MIRLCGSLLTPFRYGTIMDETFESTNPLSIVDCARLAMVSKEVREAVENNECWKDVLDVLEQDFPLVPFYSKEMEKKGMPYPEGLEGRTELFPNDWRKEFGEPRYDVEAWAALNFKQRVPLLLAFALKISKTMKEESMDTDNMDWEYIVPDEMLNRSVGKVLLGSGVILDTMLGSGLKRTGTRPTTGCTSKQTTRRATTWHARLRTAAYWRMDYLEVPWTARDPEACTTR